MRKIYCDDANGRKFSLMIDDESVVIDQAWIDHQNEVRAKDMFGLGRTAPIVKWRVEVMQSAV